MNGNDIDRIVMDCVRALRANGENERADKLGEAFIAERTARDEAPLRAELAGKEKALSAAKTVIEAKDKAYALIDQRFAAMAAKAATTDSERECNERLTAEIDALTAELAEARRLLDEARKQEPVAWMLEWTYDGDEPGRRLYDDERHCLLDANRDGGVCRPLYAAPVPAQPAVRTYSGPCMCARDHCQNRTSMPHPTWKCRKESQPAVPDDVAKDAARYRAGHPDMILDEVGRLVMSRKYADAQMVELVRQIAKYPSTRSEEMCADSIRARCRFAIEQYDAAILSATEGRKDESA